MRLSTFAISILFTTSLFAQSELALNDLDVETLYKMSLEELMNVTIVSSTGTHTKLSQAPSIATVITAKQIERSSARTLDEVLQMVPGLQVYLSPLNIQGNSYDIRGIKTGFNSQILTLINGVSIDRVFSGSRIERFTFPASAIQRVEIIRGPGSAVYGADAFSGVINIITKDAAYLAENSLVGVRYGSFERAEVYGNYGEKYESGLEMGLNLSYMTNERDSGRIIQADLQTALDSTFETSASQAPGAYDDRYDVYNMNLNLKYQNFSMNLWTYISKDMGVGVGAANALDPEGKVDISQFVVDLNYEYEPINDVKWNNKLILSYLDSKSDFNVLPAGTTILIGDDGNAFTPGGGIVTFLDGYIGNPGSQEKKIAYESTLNISTFKDQNIRVGIGYSYVKLTAQESKNFGPGVIDGTVSPINGALTDVTGTPYIYLPNKDRTIFFLSLQDEYTLAKDWQVTAGIRYDNYSDFGSTVNPRLGLVWNTTDTVTTKLLYGRAFRAPGFSELYNQNNPVSLGNEDLNPETINMIELGSRYTPSMQFITSLNLYWYQIHDLIEGVAAVSGEVSQNIGEQIGAGLEFEASYQASSTLLLSADYAYRWTDHDDTKNAVSGVPKHIAHAMFDYSITQKWFLNSEVFYTADTPREAGDTRAKIEDYAVVNLSTAYRITSALETLIAVRNLLDEEYVSPSNTNPANDYPMEGFNIYAELKYKF